MAGNNQEEDKGNGKGKGTGYSSSFNALQLEQNSILHAANNILFGSTPQIFERERLTDPISTSFQGYPERMTDSNNTFALSFAAIFTDYERAVVNPIIFYQTLITLLTLQRKIFLIPEFQGAPLDLHRIFVEVTSRGGICKITKYGRLGEVCAALPHNIGDRNLYDVYFSLLYACEAHLCNFPYEDHLRPNHPSSLSAGARQMPGVLGEQPSLAHMQTIFSCNGKQPQQCTCMNPHQRLPGSSLPLPGIRDFALPQRKMGTSSDQIPLRYLTDYPQKFTSPAVQSSDPRWVPNIGQVQPLRPQREAQVVPSRQREVPAPNSTGIHRRKRNLGIAQQSSCARLAPSQHIASRANYNATEQLNINPYVPAQNSSAEQVSLQREVGAVATEVRAANIKQEEIIFPYPVWSLHANPGSVSFLSAPEPSTFVTQVSAQTVSQRTQPLAEAQISVMQTTDSLSREDPAYGPVQNKRKMKPGENIGICNLPTTPSGDKITLEEQEAIDEPPFNMKLNSDQKDNQMKANETRAGA